jgi:hypothetical protein
VNRHGTGWMIAAWAAGAVAGLAFWSFLGWLAYLLVMHFTHGGTS